MFSVGLLTGGPGPVPSPMSGPVGGPWSSAKSSNVWSGVRSTGGGRGYPSPRYWGFPSPRFGGQGVGAGDGWGYLPPSPLPPPPEYTSCDTPLAVMQEDFLVLLYLRN